MRFLRDGLAFNNGIEATKITLEVRFAVIKSKITGNHKVGSEGA